MTKQQTRNPELETLNLPANNARAIGWLMLALLAWGCMLALGTFLYRINQTAGTAEASNRPLYRGLIVLACTLGFLGLWLLALRRRRSNGERGE